MISVDEPFLPLNKPLNKKYHLKAVLAHLNNPQTAIKTINVVGTNGKGSVTRFLALGLAQKYAKVGVFSSPAFFYQNERIAINQTLISDEDLQQYLARVQPWIEQYALTFFEIWTLIAILYFADQKVDLAVIEAGIGGVKDVTYLFSNQIATLLTMVGFDHQEVLGFDIAAILTNKVLMAKPNTKLYLSRDNTKYLTSIKKILKEQQVEVVLGEVIDDEVFYQQANKGLVKTFLHQEFQINDFDFLKAPSLPGRFQVLQSEPLLIVDGAHNPDGIEALVQSFKKKYPTKNPVVVVGCSVHKDYQTNLKILKEHFSKLYVTTFDHFQSWKLDDVMIGQKISDWKTFLQTKLANNQDVLVCGSLYFIPLVEQWYYNHH